ncbi:hypothetical protein AU468_03990 [Alkalispirochaeta sphaeroplastigenens]|uniref:Uncharacterized protein n=1 Tax=Alkalispirochaeta sphaeroplastigenens TaxID=1187066 RepID=A0A2S4JXC8_9SPIO|nr:hypothetical protein [Alkalispirochaeta sphaeroplastigenens]POR04143.1 hypothetical protein AU468_03990 [Alkalispirochaeta sphaeroplastigenens]
MKIFRSGRVRTTGEALAGDEGARAREQETRARQGVPSWTNRVLLALYLAGLLGMLVIMVVIRLRLDRMVEITL